MKTRITFFLAAGILFAFLVGCDQGKEQIVALENQVNEQNAEINKISVQNEELVTQVHTLEGKIETYENDVKAPVQISKGEKEIHELILQLHKGWELVPEENDKASLLQHFLPKYTTNGVSITADNLPTVNRNNQESFEAHLDEIIDNEKISIKFGQPQFLYTEVRENVFAACYRTLIRVYIDGKLHNTGSVISLISGPKRNEGWKVGNYNWVRFDYEK